MNPSLKLAGKWFLLALLLIIINKVQAQTGSGIVIKKVLDGAKGQLVKDSIVMVEDSIYFDAALQSKLDLPYPVRNIITFKINEYAGIYLPATFSATVNVRIYYTKPDLSVESTDQSLVINYDTAHTYAMRNSFVFNNAHRVKVEILSITAGAAILPALVLENEMELHPAFKLSCTDDAVKRFFTDNPPPPNTDSTDELPVSWPVTTGADVYDLEWAYIDSSALATNRYGNPLNPQLVFAYNTTRVTIAANAYSIPLLYDNGGVLFYRVRAVQEKGRYNRMETAWSSDYSTGLGTYNFCGHQRNLNWQSAVSFAEDGKRKVVVQYFDGSLRSRQTVTKDNTTDSTIVAETAYDYQGSPAIQVLPAPSLNNIIKYTPNLNLAINSAEYDKDKYDYIAQPADYVTASAQPMSKTSGANKYYSDNNPDKNNGINQYVPDAGGYAFTETQYTQDNTGRISRQSGIGATYKLGSNHETKYFYGTPAQEDLDALFGTEVGDKTHYFKNMVSDANGQYAVSYLDMHGRTIATALAGSPANSSLADLPTKEVREVTDSLSGPGRNTLKDLVLESQNTQLVTQDSIYHFKYVLTPPVLQKKDCDDNLVCYKGLYDLEIKITDDVYNQHLPGGKPFDTVLHNYQANVIEPVDCEGPVEAMVLEFDLYLVKGSYEITKSLSLNKQGMAYYRDSFFLKTNVCTTIEEVIEEQRKVQRDQPCFPDCQSCKANLGDWDDFRVSYVVSAGNNITDTAAYRLEAWEAYQVAVESCKALCEEVTETDDVRMAMLQDVTAPSGQYANVSENSYVYSIFYDVSEDDNVAPPYQRNDITYLDESGKPDLVYDERSDTYVKPQSLSPEQFASKFKASWAPALLKFHPEYCKLLKYQEYEASNAWDRKFEAVDTYASAKEKGYMNPTGNTNIPFPVGSSDPLAQTQGAALNSKLNNYANNYSMWSVATVSVKCGKNDDGCLGNYNTIAKAFDEDALCSGDRDMAWRSFRQGYLNLKRDIISGQLNAACPNPALAGKMPRFNSSTDALNQNGLGNVTNKNEQEAEAYAGASMNQLFEDNCKAYVQYWVRQLAPCKYDSASVQDELVPKLLQVCKEGSDLDHQRGSSTVKPSSTSPYRSFEQELNKYNQDHGSITDPLICNAQLITAPKPYDKQSAYTNKLSYTKPDDCECGKLKDLEREYLAVKKAGDANFSAYMLRTRKVTISQTDLDVLLDACNTTGTSACSWLPKPITIPVLMQCNVAPACATCTEVNNWYNTFTSTYPGIVPVTGGEVDSAQQVKNELFAGYMNNHLGFNKQAWEYLSFRDSCLNNPPATGGTVVCRPGGDLSKQMVKSYNNGGTDVITDIRRTPDNGYIMTGSTTGHSSGGKDGYIIKANVDGALLWARTYGAEQDDEFTKITPTADGGYIAIGTTASYCYDQGAILVVKVDKDGNATWNKVIDFGDHGGKGADIIETSDTTYAFAGLRSTSGTNTDWVTGVLSDIGEMNWMKQIGSADSRGTISLLQDNNVLVAATSIKAGTTAGTDDAVVIKLNRQTGELLDLSQYDLENRGNITNGILKAMNGYKLAIASLSNGSNPADNGVMLDISSTGDIQSARKINSIGALDSRSWTVHPAADGGLFASQSIGATSDVYWYKLRSDNSVQWATHVRMAGSDRLYRITQGPTGGLAGAGVLNGQSAMIMLATSTGKTGCSDTAATIADTDITSAGTRKSVVSQAIVALNSSNISTVVILENSYNPPGSIVNCPGLDSCYTVSDGPLLCGNAEPVFPSVDVNVISSCSDSSYFATSAGTVLYNAYVDSVKNDFEQAYIRTALQADALEKFAVTYSSSEYHYTLYYYDQAGNLVKTIPPAGVVKDRSTTWLNQVKAARAIGLSKVPQHRLPTDYRYNTLNAVVAQKTPDGGKSQFWYDRLGRLVVSQNAKQVTANAYSYTLYDVLSRIAEIGEIASGAVMTDDISRNEGKLSLWINNAAAAKTQITRTVYDLAYVPFEGKLWNAANLRNRVSWTALYDNAARLDTNGYSAGTFYSYDIHGNVDTLLQDFKDGTMREKERRWKKIVYRYDLVSGKVNMVSYQPGEIDAFHHRYSYDAENRITNVETSADSVYWENEAYYQYYKHGPLARAVIGQQQVQGMDYAYTLQGWLKGVNSTTLTPGFDMGHDGATGGITARDAFGYSLHYFGDDDYKPLNTTVRPFAGAGSTGSAFKPLFNGNIGAISVNLPKVGEPLFYSYGYDALNRLAKMDALRNLDAATNTWTPIAVPDFAERIAYDPNGNILAYKRDGNNTWAGKSLDMDNLTYHYKPGTNQLDAISDLPGNKTNYDNDIDGQDAGNYTYDAIGNLIRDKEDSVTIEWTVYGKIKKITKDDGTIISYTYDAAGNRISKKVNGREIWYVRDATGNVMSVYVSGDASVNSGALSQTEVHLYGSSRLGMSTRTTNILEEAPTPVSLGEFGSATNLNFTRGYKFFELSNHLENVLATVSDVKKARSVDGSTVDHYEADVTSANDYYPFGMLQPGRNWNGGNYRYGFNGKEKDDEVKGEGNELDYGMRVYDPRAGKFLSVDPLTKNFPWYTPYQFAGNTPVQAVDLDGEEERHYTLLKDKSGKPVLKMTFEKYYNEFKLFGIFPRKEKIWSERAKVTYNGTEYNIGYANPYNGMGNENKIAQFHEWAKNPDPESLARQFYSSDQSGGAFFNQTSLNLQNNILMYGPLTQKAWFSRLDDKCFVAGTQVLTSNGLKYIEDILVGDSVWSFNEVTQEIAIKPVISNSHRIAQRLVRLNVGKETIWTTYEHPFWINSGWVPAEKIQIGDSVLLISNIKSVISNKIVKDSIAAVYNFAVADYHTYYVSSLGILVHNTCFEPVMLKNNEKGGREINSQIKEIVVGRGKPRIDDVTGLQKVYRGDESPKWAGALEYEVPVTGRKNEVRILRLQTGTNPTTGEPQYKYGWSTNHYIQVHDFKPVNSTPNSAPQQK